MAETDEVFGEEGHDRVGGHCGGEACLVTGEGAPGLVFRGGELLRGVEDEGAVEDDNDCPVMREQHVWGRMGMRTYSQ